MKNRWRVFRDRDVAALPFLIENSRLTRVSNVLGLFIAMYDPISRSHDESIRVEFVK